MNTFSETKDRIVWLYKNDRVRFYLLLIVTAVFSFLFTFCRELFSNILWLIAGISLSIFLITLLFHTAHIIFKALLKAATGITFTFFLAQEFCKPVYSNAFDTSSIKFVFVLGLLFSLMYFVKVLYFQIFRNKKSILKKLWKENSFDQKEKVFIFSCYVLMTMLILSELASVFGYISAGLCFIN